MKRSIALLLIFISANCYSQLNIVPMPAEVTIGKGNFLINKNTGIFLEGSGLEKIALFFNDALQKKSGYKLKLVSKKTPGNTITLNFERLDYEIPGAYNLLTDKDGIYIAGDNETGVFYGVQTLMQLLPINDNKILAVPQLFIRDYPRFAYRGMHLDVSRHFFPVAYVKRYIDYLAFHKFNTFHWHLTDDQGWRIEIKKYPKLTAVGGWRAGTIIGRYPGTGNDSIRYGGYYTQEQIKDVVKYAADRYISILPEIDIPGHSMALLAAYPELGTDPAYPYKVSETWGINGPFNNVLNPSEKTFKFLEGIFDEVLPLFPSRYIHIGGDECSKTWWKQSSFCQQLIKENGLKDEHGLQSYFIQRVEKYINSKGKKIIGWDEILEGGLAPNAAVMSWTGEEGGITAAKQGHDVVMTPGAYCYFDHSQTRNEDSVTIGSYLPLEMVYNYEPIPAVLNADQAKHILGAQANLWTEYIGFPSKVEYMIFPRMSALSEVLWSPKENRNWPDFEKRMPALMERYDSWRANYSKAYYNLEATARSSKDNVGLIWEVKKKPNDLQAMEIVYKSKSDSLLEVPLYDSLGNLLRMLRTDTVSEVLFLRSEKNLAEVLITKPGIAKAELYKGKKYLDFTAKVEYDYSHPFSVLTQKFYFNKATGKKISLKKEAAKNYPGDGAFTLINGIQNEKGFPRSNEFLGFLSECEATIDLVNAIKISKVTIHALHRPSSWIWKPSSTEVLLSTDGINFTTANSSNNFVLTSKENGTITIAINPTEARFVKLLIKSQGKVPEGNPGSGSNAWLFLDEIEVD